jgi:hypothetical protein
MRLFRIFTLAIAVLVCLCTVSAKRAADLAGEQEMLQADRAFVAGRQARPRKNTGVGFFLDGFRGKDARESRSPRESAEAWNHR